MTFSDEELKGGVPGIGNNLLPRLVAAQAPEFALRTGKVYAQTRGPRFETRAEIRIIKD